MEIGCAPGKLIAWVVSELEAEASGLDYSANGISFARNLFTALSLKGDLRCEDLLATTFQPSTFDVVFSAGVIEHFEDPRPIISRHLDLVRSGGIALITIPNYGGWMGRVQRYLDPQNLDIHNLDIMSVAALRLLAPAGMASVRAYPWGRFSSSIFTLETAMPLTLARVLQRIINAIAMLQPVDIDLLSPLLVLEIEKR